MLILYCIPLHIFSLYRFMDKFYGSCNGLTAYFLYSNFVPCFQFGVPFCRKPLKKIIRLAVKQTRFPHEI